MAEIKISEAPKIEAGYQAKRGGLYMLGKAAILELEHNPTVIGNIGSLFTGLGNSVAAFVGIGSTAALSAGLTQMDYMHKREKVKDFYQEELAAKLKKSPEKVTTTDLDTLAKENHTVSEEMNRAQRQRNFGVGLSFLASMASLAVVSIVVTPILADPALFAGVSEILAHGAKLAISAVVGLLTYNTVKEPLHWIGDKLFDLDAKTTHDRIVSLTHDRAAGKIISREQVLAVFADANPQLEQYIKARYGDEFDNLALAVKQQATEELSRIVPVDQLVTDINSGKINVSELAFAVEGKISGVEHKGNEDEKKKSGMLTQMWAKVRHAVGLKDTPEAAQTITTPVPTPNDTRAYYPGNNAGFSFVEKYNLRGKDASLSHAERLNQQAQSDGVSLPTRP